MCGCRKGSAATASRPGTGTRASTPLIYGEDDISLPVRRGKILVAPEGVSIPTGVTRWVRGTGVEAAVEAGYIEF